MISSYNINHINLFISTHKHFSLLQEAIHTTHTDEKY